MLRVVLCLVVSCLLIYLLVPVFVYVCWFFVFVYVLSPPPPCLFLRCCVELVSCFVIVFVGLVL